MRIGIIGAAGYTAGELLRILLQHPQAEIVWLYSQSQAGKPVWQTHQDLVGDTDLVFSDQINYSSVDCVFICSGHGEAKKILAEKPAPADCCVIDLSHDFRLRRPDHDFVYGLPELNRETIRQSKRIANPGCFATAIQLALLPLASKGLLTDAVHVNAITGSTGAGQKPTDTTHFSWRNNNVSIYKAFEHQHLGEIGQSLRDLQPDFAHPLHFIPVRGNFSRGILATAYTTCPLDLAEAQQLYRDFYQSAPFTHVVDFNPDVKLVVNTNKCLVYLEKHGDILLIVSVIDNLGKGASSQAVQNMNLAFGLDEATGLHLKPIAF